MSVTPKQLRDWYDAEVRWRTQPALTPAQQAADPFAEGYPDEGPCDGPCGAANSEDCTCDAYDAASEVLAP